MLTIIRTSHFKKDVKQAIKRGKNLENLKSIMQLLSTKSPLPPKLRNHKLSGEGMIVGNATLNQTGS